MANEQGQSKAQGPKDQVGMWIGLVLLGGLIPLLFFVVVALSPR